MKYVLALVVVGLMTISVGTCIHDVATGEIVQKVKKEHERHAQKCAKRDFVTYREYMISCH